MTDVAPAHTIATEEVFGPVLAVMTFRTYNEAIEIANYTRYGLAASIWSENVNLALEMASKKAGVIWVNCTNEFDAAVGFNGGYRESGFGQEGAVLRVYGRIGAAPRISGQMKTRRWTRLYPNFLPVTPRLIARQNFI